MDLVQISITIKNASSAPLILICAATAAGNSASATPKWTEEDFRKALGDVVMLAIRGMGEFGTTFLRGKDDGAG